jgi:mono/diheme cytochrome c family protein
MDTPSDRVIRSRQRHLLVSGLVCCALALLCREALASQADVSASRDGARIYQNNCAACHGTDGRGNAESVVGFDVPLPDFTDCLFATVEAAEGWETVVREGGPIRALDRHMPAFGQALSEDEIRLVVSHVRTFCTSRGWPQGDLNLPRALVTEKAYPENEALFTMSIGREPTRNVGNTFIYERRFGARSQYEVNVPFDAQRGEAGAWLHGLGDVAIAVKHAVFDDVGRGSIVSLGEEVSLPTGKQSEGLGKGFTVFESFVAAGQMLPRASFLQFHGGIEIPSDGARASKEAFWRTAIGKTITQRSTRRWTPMLEVVGARELESGARAEWDVVPQMQVTVSKRQHIMISGGLQVPLNGRDERASQFLTYFLWDWYEGGLFDGWR